MLICCKNFKVRLFENKNNNNNPKHKARQKINKLGKGTLICKFAIGK